MNFVLSQHAQEEIYKRKIPLQIVHLILDYPEQIVEEDGLKVYQGIFTATNHKNYLLRIYVNDLVDPAKIVTLYMTSKINKYRSFSNES